MKPMILFPLVSVALIAAPSLAQSTNPIFPVTFTTPKSWKLVKTLDNNAVLLPTGATVIDSLLATHTGVYEKLEPLVAGLALSLKDLNCTNVQISEEGEKQVKGRKAYVAKGSAVNAQGIPVVFAIYATLSGKQLGAGLVMLSSKEQSAEAFRAAEALLGSFQFGTFTPSKAAATALIGTWESSKSEGSRTSGVGGVSVASSNRYTFQSTGRFTSQSRSIVSASGEFGDFGSSLSKNSEEEDEGQFFVVGKKLIFSSAKRGTRVGDYTLQGGILKIGGVLLRRR
jgi:hypothetical protein